MFLRDLGELFLLLPTAGLRAAHHVLVVTDVRDVLVDWYHVHVLQADVDAHGTRLAVPEEVGQLFSVGDVVGGVHVSGALEVFQEYVARSFYTDPCTVVVNKIVSFGLLLHDFV